MTDESDLSSGQFLVTLGMSAGKQSEKTTCLAPPRISYCSMASTERRSLNGTLATLMEPSWVAMTWWDVANVNSPISMVILVYSIHLQKQQAKRILTPCWVVRMKQMVEFFLTSCIDLASRCQRLGNLLFRFHPKTRNSTLSWRRPPLPRSTVYSQWSQCCTWFK